VEHSHQFPGPVSPGDQCHHLWPRNGLGS
jgi:hypothetical protein